MKQMRSIGLAVLVTLMLLSMPGKAGHAKETPSPEWVTALPAAAKTEQLIVVGGRQDALCDETCAVELPDRDRFAGKSGGKTIRRA